MKITFVNTVYIRYKVSVIFPGYPVRFVSPHFIQINQMWQTAGFSLFMTYQSSTLWDFGKLNKLIIISEILLHIYNFIRKKSTKNVLRIETDFYRHFYRSCYLWIVHNIIHFYKRDRKLIKYVWILLWRSATSWWCYAVAACSRA